MKKLIATLLIVILSTSAALAAGGKNQIKNQGESGQGQTHTGTQSKGSASQVRAGR